MINPTEIEQYFNTNLAACRGVDISLFYPDSRSMRYRPRIRAIEFCKKCEVIQGCLDYALRFEPLGIWGGTNEVEREILRRQEKINLPIERSQSVAVRRALRSGRIKKQIERPNNG